MDNKKFIGTFHSEEEAIRKIDELKSEGYANDDIYAVAKNHDDISMVRGRTDVDTQTVDGSWIDRFMAFLSGDEPVRGALRNMGLTDDVADRYYSEIDSGAILLYVDREYGNLYDSGENITRSADPNLGPDPVGTTDAAAHLDNDRTTDEYELNDTLGKVGGEQKMRLYEEKLNIDKEEVPSGEVRVEKNVVEDEQKVDIPVSREEVYVERREVDNPSAYGETSAAFQDDGKTIRIPLSEEKVEVTKRPVVSEEIIVGKKKVEDTETVREKVRREEAEFEGLDDAPRGVQRDSSYDSRSYDVNNSSTTLGQNNKDYNVGYTNENNVDGSLKAQGFYEDNANKTMDKTQYRNNNALDSDVSAKNTNPADGQYQNHNSFDDSLQAKGFYEDNSEFTADTRDSVYQNGNPSDSRTADHTYQSDAYDMKGENIYMKDPEDELLSTEKNLREERKDGLQSRKNNPFND